MVTYHGYISWLHFMVTYHGYISWLYFIVTFHGYISWLQVSLGFCNDTLVVYVQCNYDYFRGGGIIAGIQWCVGA